jgi:hypothetical protein
MSYDPSIKPIETHYKGYRFRSRLEARWAVFFDALGLQWEYEPQDFQTSAGRYLPDFRIQHVAGREIYVEVKPDTNLTSEENRKITAFWREVCNQDQCLVVTRGDPLALRTFLLCKSGEGFALPPHLALFPFLNGDMIDGDRDDGGANEVLDSLQVAATVARQARFEHGETPR